VFSNAISATDSVKGWTHGYAMALTNAQNTGSVLWSTNTTTEFGGIFTNTMALMEINMDGYTESQTIKTKAGSNLQSTYPAFYYALNYGIASIGGTKYAAPSGTSGWYLPSIGQWYLIVKNLGGMTVAPTDASGFGYWSNPAAFNAATAINTNYLSKVTSADLIDVTSSSPNYRYFWCSSEWSSSVACNIHFDGNGILYLGYINKTGTSSDYRVRSVIAL
jgi:hypothetical protein